MVRVQSEIKRALLRSLWRAAQASSTTLREALDGFQQTPFNTLSSGQILVSAGGGGYHSALKIPALSDQLTQEQVWAFSEEMLNVFYDSISNLALQTPPVIADVGGSFDQQIFQVMIFDDRLQGVRSQRGDWTGLNVPSIGGVPAP